MKGIFKRELGIFFTKAHYKTFGRIVKLKEYVNASVSNYPV